MTRGVVAVGLVVAASCAAVWACGGATFEATPGDDAGHADGATSDASDDGSTAEGATGDVGRGGVSCAGRLDRHDVCADFDEGQVVTGGLTGSRSDGIARLSLDVDASVSPPASLKSEVTTSTGAPTAARVYWDVPELTRATALDVSFDVSAIAAVTSGTLELFALQETTPARTFARIAMGALDSTPFVSVKGLASDGSVVEQRFTFAALAGDRFVHVDAVLPLASGVRLRITVDGTPLVDVLPTVPPIDARTQRLSFELGGWIDAPGSLVLRYDNLVIDAVR